MCAAACGVPPSAAPPHHHKVHTTLTYHPLCCPLPPPLPPCRQGPTLRECVLLHAVSRLVLHPHITNIQASWVKMGPQQAGRLLAAGCNDMGGSIMNESITRAAGACVQGTWGSLWQGARALVCLWGVCVWGGVGGGGVLQL